MPNNFHQPPPRRQQEPTSLVGRAAELHQLIAALDHAVRGSGRTLLLAGAKETLNPKTALFFLAFITQFINPHGHAALQFLLLGSISVVLNSAVDLIVAVAAGPIGHHLRSNAQFRKRQRLGTGTALIGLGAYAALTRNR